MYQSGNGSKNTSQRDYQPGEKKVHGYAVDETQIKFGSQYMWLWVAIEPKHREILRIDVSVERAMLVAKSFISSLKMGMESILFLSIREVGIRRHAVS